MTKKCDCNYNGGCQTCTGEAVYRVKRGSETLYLCTRCHLGGDVKQARLFDKADIPRLVTLDAGRSNNPVSEAMDALIDMFGGMGVMLLSELDRLPLEAAAYERESA